ncbi:hypothetical protein QJS66_00475 [Kocuria rhizophila]|nr:hypothetical protein QJS66_00475 [Kocuria rhizophila]
MLHTGTARTRARTLALVASASSFWVVADQPAGRHRRRPPQRRPPPRHPRQKEPSTSSAKPASAAAPRHRASGPARGLAA